MNCRGDYTKCNVLLTVRVQCCERVIMEKHGESQCSGTAAPAGEEKAANAILDEEFLMW